MSDLDARQLERAAARSGSLDDRARALREQLRLGRLDPERLALAAALGDPAARSLSPEVAAAPDDLRGFAATMEAIGRVAVMRAALAALSAYPFTARLLTQPYLAAAYEASEAWARCPCAPCARRALECSAVVRQREPTMGASCLLLELIPLLATTERERRAARGAGVQVAAEADLHRVLEFLCFKRGVGDGLYSVPSDLTHERLHESWSRVRPHIVSELLAWSLGG